MDAHTIARIRLDDSFAKQFQAYIIKEIVKKVRLKAPRVKDELTNKIRQAVRLRLSQADEYQEIAGGTLRAQLGIPNAESRISDIIEVWIQGIRVDIAYGKKPFLNIHIGMIKDDYSDVLSLDASTYTYIRSSPPEKAGQTQIIPWLQWLLLEGDRRIILDYEFSPTKIGRSGMSGVMRKNNKKAWQVPSEFSGTSVDNFATRALDGIEIEIEKIVETTLMKLIK